MPNANFGVVPFVEGAGEALFEQIEARGMEGVVGKRADSAYETGRRSDSWRKVINWTYADVYITGYKKAEFGWLAGVADGTGKVRPAGIIELGVGPTERKAFYGVSKALVTGENRDFVFVEPRIRAKVKMRNWPKSGVAPISSLYRIYRINQNETPRNENTPGGVSFNWGRGTHTLHVDSKYLESSHSLVSIFESVHRKRQCNQQDHREFLASTMYSIDII